MGPTESGGFGPAPLSHSELLAWQINMGRRLQPWEVNMIRRLSVEYVAESQRAQDADAPAPWSDEEVTAEERRAVGLRLRDSMRKRVR